MRYEISIKEVLQRKVCVEADSSEEALSLVEKLYDDGEIVLDSEDYTPGTVEFTECGPAPEDIIEEDYNAVDYKEEI